MDKNVKDYMSRIGAKGGSVRGRSKARSRKAAQRAARARWGKAKR